MSNNIAIRIEDVSKLYRLGQLGTGTLGQDIHRWWARVRGQEDPFLKIGETNDRTTKGSSDFVWALKNISFDIQQGDAVGIIGKNGAGKSTLLKLLSRTTQPTTGKIKINGRIASLLEVGTGFHPELSGRENIYLNGAILGMTKREITRRFDEIVDFSGVERYIDTPVKRYSSGMYVRLAFAVAAHLESEILILDEVLAVGDIEFQRKCLGKLDSISYGQGRTVLFVSHNIGAIRMLCNKGVLLEHGTLTSSGTIDDVINLYIRGKNNQNFYRPTKEPKGDAFIAEAWTHDAQGNSTGEYNFTEQVEATIVVQYQKAMEFLHCGVALQDMFGNRIFTVMKNLDEYGTVAAGGTITVKLKLPSHLIAPGHYSFLFALFKTDGTTFDWVEEVCPIDINDTGTPFSIFQGDNYGYFHVDAEWA